METWKPKKCKCVDTHGKRESLSLVAGESLSLSTKFDSVIREKPNLIFNSVLPNWMEDLEGFNSLLKKWVGVR